MSEPKSPAEVVRLVEEWLAVPGNAEQLSQVAKEATARARDLIDSKPRSLTDYIKYSEEDIVVGIEWYTNRVKGVNEGLVLLTCSVDNRGEWCLRVEEVVDMLNGCARRGETVKFPKDEEGNKVTV